MAATLVTSTTPVAKPVVLRRTRRSHIPFRVHTAPLLLAAACFAGGILLAHLHPFLPGLLGVALLLSLFVGAAVNLYAPRLTWSVTALVYVQLGIFCFSAAPGVDPQAEFAFLADGTSRSIEGEIVGVGPLRSVAAASPFSTKIREERTQQIDLRLQNISGAAVSSGSHAAVRVTLYAPVDAVFLVLRCGERLRGHLAMHTQERFLDPGVWDTTAYLHAQGIGALASAHAQDLVPISFSHRGHLGCWIRTLQQSASARLNSFAIGPDAHSVRKFFLLDQEDAAMLAAMLTGDRTYLRHRLRVGFERTGSFHLLVVSGLHLAIFSSVAFFICRQLHLSRLWASLLTIAASTSYAVFTGFGHPVQRALGMVTVYLLERLLWRDRSAFNAIGLVALVLLAADPSSLFDSGLQMSLLSVIAIAGVAAPVAERTFGPYLHAMRNLNEIRIDPALLPRIAQFRVSVRMMAQHLQPIAGRFLAWIAYPFAIKTILRVVELLLVSTGIELFMMLPMALYFHRVTLLALPVNLLIVPLLSLLLPSAAITFVAIACIPSIAFIPAAATAVLLHSVTWVVSIFSSIRAADFRNPMPASSAIVLWIALCTAAICLVRLRRFALTRACIALIAAAAVLVISRPLTHRKSALEISAIDVGQGDSLLLITPEGKTLLIDAGGQVGASPDSNFDVGEDVVSPVLWSRGIQRLDAVAITHAHADHIGGMPAILENFRPRELWVGKNPDVPSYDRVLAIAAHLGAKIETHVAGDAFSFGGVTMHVLAPEPSYLPGREPANNDSLVLRVTYGQTSALLEGDAEAASEARMVAAGGLKSDLLKVAHHGSITSTTPPFLAAVSPAYSMISVGRRNFYGHPRREVLRELQSAKIKTYLTETTGLTTFYLDGNAVSAESWPAVHR